MKPEDLYSIFIKLDDVQKKDFISLLFEEYNSEVLINALNSHSSTTRFPDYINTEELKRFLSDED